MTNLVADSSGRRTAAPGRSAWRFKPAGVPLRTPCHPGVFLARTCLVPLHMSQSEAARQLGLSRRRLHELVHGKRMMTPDTAIRCATLFGIDASFWLMLQSAWDSFHAWKRLSHPALAPVAGESSTF